MNDSSLQLQPVLSSDEEELAYPQSNGEPSKFSLFNTQSIKECMFNLKYNLMHSKFLIIPYLHRQKIQLEVDSQPAYLLGKVYDHTTHNRFLDHFKSIIWLTYRSKNNKLKGDAGWGCMIRVVQMVLAEIIKRLNSEIFVNDIIELFKQGQGHLLSLENICKKGSIKQRSTGPNQTLLCVYSILSEFHNSQMQNKSLGEKQSSKINLNFSLQMYLQKFTIKNLQSFSLESFPKVIIISTKISFQNNSHFPQIYTDHAKHLMKMATFCGMIAAVSSQALYVVGFQDDKVICLDPHYVQAENEQQSLRYFKSTPRGLPFTQLNPKVSFCFYFKDSASYLNWAAEIYHSHKLFMPYVVLNLQLEGSQDIIEKYRKRSQDFQTL